MERAGKLQRFTKTVLRNLNQKDLLVPSSIFENILDPSKQPTNYRGVCILIKKKLNKKLKEEVQKNLKEEFKKKLNEFKKKLIEVFKKKIK